MPWTRERKEQTRRKILESAVRLFSSRGFDNVSIGDVMQGADMTHGAFYAHFSSKQALYAEAILSAARASTAAKLVQERSEAQRLIEQLMAAYLDPGHVRQEQPPCPLAFLATDVANREEGVRSAYTQVFRRLVALLNKELPVDTPSRRNRALALAAMMIGGVAVSRALDDDAVVDSLLKACRELGGELIGPEAQ